MSRKDTIIIAVLVNAGLLMALFATAMRSNKKEESKVAEIAVAVEKPAATESTTLAQTENILDATVGAQSILDETASDMLGEEIDMVAMAPVSEVTAPVAPVISSTPQVVATTPIAATQTKSEESSSVTITVKKGDVLEKIARHNNSTVALIMKANNLSSTNLKIGQVLKVPAKGKKEATAAVAKSEGTEAEYYTVKEGDSPWLIASRNKVKLDDLLRLNAMDEQKAKRLKPGDKLRLR